MTTAHVELLGRTSNRSEVATLEHQALLKTLIAYHEAFAEPDPARRLELLGHSMTPDAEIWGPKRVFAGYEAISEKIERFHGNFPAMPTRADDRLQHSS